MKASVESFHEAGQVLAMFLRDPSPNGIDVLREEGISLHGMDMSLHLLGNYLVLELLVAADLAVNAEDLLDVGELVIAEDELRTGGHDIDLNRGRSTRS